MGSLWRYVRLLLLALALLHAVSFVVVGIERFAGRDGLLLAPGSPVAGDFINLYAAAQMVLSGRVAEIFDPAAFAAHQASLIAGEIGLRLWAYPPHSLLLVWPFGLGDFFTALGLWSVAGLALLVAGARRFGFGWIETAILVLSPGSLHALYFGQTGNLAGGLLLLALSSRRAGDPVPGIAAALLTIKPQLGFLLPLLWAIERRWKRIGLAAGATLLLVVLSLVTWGIGPWRDYLHLSLPLLGLIETEATGELLHMIPSVFISGRIVGLGGDVALLVHLGFAICVAALLVWRLLVVADGRQRAALLLLGTALISPYLHSYDLVLLAAAALLVGRLAIDRLSTAGLLVGMLVVIVWGLPNLLLTLNKSGFPVAPLPILLLFLVAAFLRPRGEP